MLKKQNFGFELEFKNITRKEAAFAISNKFGWSAPEFTSSYSTWTTIDNQGRKWKVVKDSSINAREDEQCELVTPILKYEDIELLQEVVRVLRKTGAKVDWSCGIHIHIDKANHNAKTLRNLINIVSSKEDMMFQAFGVDNTRKGSYCKPIRTDLVETVNKSKTTDLSVLGEMWYKGYSDRYSHYSQSRYFGLNLHNVWYAQTVEFRYFNSTLHAGEVKSYIQFCLAISAQAIQLKNARHTKTQTDNVKFTFRVFLNNLGLIGDEFKTARLHLLKNLDGNSAWRYGRPA